MVGTLAASERVGALTAAHVRTQVVGGKISGTKKPVADAADAQILITLAREDSGLGLFLVEAEQAEVTRTPLEMNDASRPAAKVVFDGANAECDGTRVPLLGLEGSPSSPECKLVNNNKNRKT